MHKLFDGVYKGKNVLVTGHTGFKGSWLSLWLVSMGARVTGYSAYLPSKPCNFQISGIAKLVNHIEGDILDFVELSKTFNKCKPDIVFHLAAQPIVKVSYENPKKTFDTNAGGTLNVMECIRESKYIKVAVLITSDKCYRNKEWTWGYRENDELGGDDPYSASKGCAEIIVRSYVASYHNRARIATARAGNVIGGGDWANARIIPDSVRSWSKKKTVMIRNPNSTRPWQHVLEPLSGYLWLGANLYKSNKLHGEPFNFGPDARVTQSVQELLESFSTFWPDAKWKKIRKNSKEKESTLLKLSCDKSLSMLQWSPVLDFHNTVKLTAEWYREYYKNNSSMFKYTLDQIKYYTDEAAKQGLAWAKR
jgi:CDP-glucose 4,6-dehydratase